MLMKVSSKRSFKSLILIPQTIAVEEFNDINVNFFVFKNFSHVISGIDIYVDSINAFLN